MSGGSVSDGRRGSILLVDRMIGMVSSHIDNLSGERVDPPDGPKHSSASALLPSPGGRKSSSTPPLREPSSHVAVIASSDPTFDSDTIMRLIPGRFRCEYSREAVVLVETNTPSPLRLMIIGSKSNRSDIPNSWRNVTLLMEDDEVKSAMEKCGGRAATVIHHEVVETSWPKYSAMTVIRLNGGGNIVMMTPDFVNSMAGRKSMASFIALQDKTEDSSETSPRVLSQTMHDETLLQELEVEFDPRYARRLSSTSDGPRRSLSSSVDLPPAPFPSLSMSLQRKHGFMQHDVPVNSSKPITFETDLFSGKLMLLMRPKEPSQDRLYREFFADSDANLVVQIQGKFKYAPQGTVYAGIELTEEMKPALVTRSMCGLILRNIRRKHPNVHYSYGDETEKPHIVVPAWTFFDRMVVTKTHVTPPGMDQLFPETQGSVVARQASGSNGAWNMNDTYSFSFCSLSVDFPTWKLTKLGYSYDVDLNVFWGASPVRMVLYEHRDATVAPYQHLQKYNHYLIALQISFSEETQGDNSMDDSGRRSSARSTSLTWGKARSSARFDESYTAMVSDLSELVDEEEDSSMEEDWEDRLRHDELPTIPTKDLLAKADPLCPAWIDVIVPRKSVKVYAFVVNGGENVILRAASEFKSRFDVRDATQYVQRVSSARVSAAEESRRVFGYVLAKALVTESESAKAWSSEASDIDSAFLVRSNQAIAAGLMRKNVLKAGYMARALSERHWKEEYARLFDTHMAFFHPGGMRPNFRIYLTTVTQVWSIESGKGPALPGFSFLEVETLGRTEYLMFRTEEERDAWEEAINDGVEAIKTTLQDGSPLEGIDNPTDQFLHKSSTWECQQRRILNCRRFYFEAPNQGLDPSTMVEDALLLAYEAQETGQEETLLKFLDSVAALKIVDVYGLNEGERLAFVLNLYHLMIMHSYLLLGPPENSFQFINMFKMVSYQLSDDIFTILELEHNIIRAAMNYPNQSGNSFFLPKSQFGFALKEPDHRINFALNCGSLDFPEYVPIFKSQILNFQLDSVALLFMEVVKVELRMEKVMVTLPRVCQWYFDDFGGTTMGLLEKVEAFLDDQKRKILKSAGEDEERIMLNYLPFQYKCRYLKLEGKKTMASSSFHDSTDGLSNDGSGVSFLGSP